MQLKSPNAFTQSALNSLLFKVSQVTAFSLILAFFYTKCQMQKKAKITFYIRRNVITRKNISNCIHYLGKILMNTLLQMYLPTWMDWWNVRCQHWWLWIYTMRQWWPMYWWRCWLLLCLWTRIHRQELSTQDWLLWFWPLSKWRHLFK